MKKTKRRSRNTRTFSVNHYWAKTADFAYGGELQTIAIELILALIMLPITIYCYGKPGLGIFFVGFLIPTFMFTVGAMVSIYYYLRSDGDEQRKVKKDEKLKGD